MTRLVEPDRTEQRNRNMHDDANKVQQVAAKLSNLRQLGSRVRILGENGGNQRVSRDIVRSLQFLALYTRMSQITFSLRSCRPLKPDLRRPKIPTLDIQGGAS